MKMVGYTSLMSVIKQVLLEATYDTSINHGATISADGNTAFVTDWSQGIQIIGIAELFNGDASVATSPSLTGSLDTSEWSYGLTISADGDTAFVADGAGGIQIIDVSNKASPSLTGSLDTSGYAYDVTLSADGNTAFVADGGGGIQIIDVSNLASPSLKSTFDTSGNVEDVVLSADGNTAFVAEEVVVCK